MTELRDRLRRLVGQLCALDDLSRLADGDSLERSHLMDSMRTLELIVAIEDKFGITVRAEDAVPENFDSIAALVAYVARKCTEEGVELCASPM